MPELASDFDPDQYPFPISHPSDHAVATSFLGRVGLGVALYTAAHNLAAGTLPAQKWPRVDEWAWIAKTICVHTSRDLRSRPADLVVPTAGGIGGDKTGGPGPITPTFAFLRAFDDTTIWDGVHLPASSTSALFPGALDRYSVVDLDETATPPDESEIICVGYPPVEADGLTEAWPESPPARLTGNLIGMRDGHYQASFASIKGFSGGPVFTHNGHFVGMLTGNDVTHIPPPRRDLARIIPSHVLRKLQAD